MRKLSKTRQAIISYLIVILFVAISVLLTATNSPDFYSSNTDVIADSTENLSITRTIEDKTISVKFDFNSNEVVSFEENGEQIKPEEYNKKYPAVITQMKKDILVYKEEEQNRYKDNQNLELFFQKVNDYLISKGYQTEKAAFRMKFKYLWHLNFSDKAYLNNKILPSDITEEVYKMYYNTTGNKKTLVISMPDGLGYIKVNNFRFDIILKG